MEPRATIDDRRKTIVRPTAALRLTLQMALRGIALAAFFFAVVPRVAIQAQQGATQRPPLPTRIADSTFWRMSTSFSEPGGYFQSDNWTSNEGSFPSIVNALTQRGRTGGAYLGVGPEQNFHYIVALRPQIVFQLDIRRQAIIQHLIYKAIFELTADRAAFISMLFSMPRPDGLTGASTIDQIWQAYLTGSKDSAEYQTNLARITNQLVRTHGFPLTVEDVASLTYVYQTFCRLGPNINYSGSMSAARYYQSWSGTTFATLTNRVDSAGIPRSFLATEETFNFMKGLHRNNLIIPVVGDFAGPHAIRAVASYLSQHNTTVTAFYVSNVESYLFRSMAAQQFYANAATLPLDSTSVFIRPSGGAMSALDAARVASGMVVASTPIPPNASLCLMQPFLAAAAAGRVPAYQDSIRCVR